MTPPQAISYTTAVCTHNCPDGCAVRVGVTDGRIVSLEGDPDHPITQGFLCGKVNRYAERVYHPARIRTPLRRVGAKGEGRFAPISWGEALDEIATRFRDAIAKYGAESILPCSFSGSVGRVSMYIGHRLFHALGASRLARTICSTQAVEGQRYTTGVSVAEAVWWPRDHAAANPGAVSGLRGNVNRLISAETSDLSGGSRFQDCLVQVEAMGTLEALGTQMADNSAATRSVP